MRGNATDLSRKTLLAGAAWLLLAASPALAQDTGQNGGTWSLPAPTGQPSAQGPVDPLNPVVRPEPRTSAPTPAPSSVPTIAAPPPPAPTATATPPRQTPSPAPSTATPRSAPPATEQAPATPAASPDTPTASTPAPAVPDATPAPSEPAAPSSAGTPQGAGFNLWWLALPLVLLALGAFAWLRCRRPPEELEWDTDDAVVEETTPEEPAPAMPAPAIAIPQPAFADKTPAPAPAPRQDLEIVLEPVSLRISLVYATLQYRLSITATQDRPAGHLLGDMISAHASLSQEDQLAPSLDVLAPLREVPALRAGETQVLTGEIQLPLNAIRPLQRGNASFLVPLVRLCLTGGLTGEAGPELRRVFTVGQPGTTALAPIRIDTGSRTVDSLAAREIEAARSVPAAPAPARRVAG